MFQRLNGSSQYIYVTTYIIIIIIIIIIRIRNMRVVSLCD